MTLTFLVAGALDVLFAFGCDLLENPEICYADMKIVSICVALLPPIIFAILCYYCAEATCHKFVKLGTYIYSLLMLSVLIVIISGFFKTQEVIDDNYFQNGHCVDGSGKFTTDCVTITLWCGFCNISNQFFLFLSGLYMLCGILHPKDLLCLPASFVYYLLMPTMFIFLNIYSFTGLNNMSWGTREDKGENDGRNESSRFALFTCKLGKLFSCKFCYIPLSWFGVKRNLAHDYDDSQPRAVVDRDVKNVKIVKVENVKVESSIRKDKFCEYDLPDKFNLGKFDRTVDEDVKRETAYWESLIKKYLYVEKPASEEHKKKIIDGLASLRDKFLLIFYGMNISWLVLVVALLVEIDTLSFQVQGLFCGNSGCGTTTLNPMSAFFLVFYFVLLGIQLLCMMVHRWSSLLTYLSQVTLFIKDFGQFDKFMGRAN